jgi:hypothetical protein
MPLVLPTLQQQLEAAFTTAFSNKSASPETAAKVLALQIATAVDAYIRTAQVQPGQLVVGSGGGVPGPMAGATTTPGSLF